MSLFSLVLSVALMASDSSPSAVPAQDLVAGPNFIVILADDCSAREIGCYGHPSHRTPNLDALARTGVMFKTCWATPICSPTRAEIMTGRYGFRTRWFHNEMKPKANYGRGTFCRNHRVFAEMLQKAGYATAVVGKWQLFDKPAEYGFDESCLWGKGPGKKYDGPVEGPDGSLPGRPARFWHPAIVRNGKQLDTGPDDYGPDLFTDFINEFATRHKDERFLVYFSLPLTHLAWDFELKKNTYVPVPERDASGTKTGRRTADTLQANVEYMDFLVGRIVDHLDKIGLRERTVILFTADNGTAGYGKGNLNQERGPRVPLIVNSPLLVKPQGPVDALADLSDIFPTLTEFAGVRVPSDYILDGHSLIPVLRGLKTQVRDWIFSFYADRRFLRDTRWLLDGNGRFWDCGSQRDEQGYKNVTASKKPEVLVARARFAEILKQLPGPDPDDYLVGEWEQFKAQKKARLEKKKENTR